MKDNDYKIIDVEIGNGKPIVKTMKKFGRFVKEHVGEIIMTATDIGVTAYPLAMYIKTNRPVYLGLAVFSGAFCSSLLAFVTSINKNFKKSRYELDNSFKRSSVEALERKIEQKEKIIDVKAENILREEIIENE